MLYFAYCMDKYAKSEEESLTKICVSFVEINTDTECIRTNMRILWS